MHYTIAAITLEEQKNETPKAMYLSDTLSIRQVGYRKGGNFSIGIMCNLVYEEN